MRREYCFAEEMHEVQKILEKSMCAVTVLIITNTRMITSFFCVRINLDFILDVKYSNQIFLSYISFTNLKPNLRRLRYRT